MQLSPIAEAERLNRSEGDQSLLPDGTGREYEGEEVNVSPELIGNTVNTIASLTPSVTGTVGESAARSAASTAASGGSAKQVGQSAFQSLMQGLISQGLTSLLGNTYGAANVASNTVTEVMKSNPNFGRAALESAVPTAVGVASNIALPGLGLVTGPVSGYMTNKSLKDGALGDLAGSRQKEHMRDVLEDEWGSTRSETKGLNDVQNALDSVGYSTEKTNVGLDRDLSVLGIDDAYESTRYGQLDKAARKSSLQGYFDKEIEKFGEDFDFGEVDESVTDTDPAGYEGIADSMGNGPGGESDNDSGAGGATGGDKDGGYY